MKEKEILHAQLLQAHKLESVGQLASGIAHEINTPTQFVSSNVGFLDEVFNDVQKIVVTLVDASAQKALTDEVLKRALETADWPYLEKEIPTDQRPAAEHPPELPTKTALPLVPA